MAIYLTNQINLINVQILDIKFHKKLDLLAISVIKETSIGSILIGNNNGIIFDECTVSQPQPASSILWHPTKPLLAIGWSDGCVTIFDGSKNSRHNAPHIHILPIASFAWSSHGSRLLSADIEGNLHAWKIDLNGEFSQNPMYSFKAGCPINCIVLRIAKMSGTDVYDIRELAKAAVNGDERALDLMSFSGNGGVKFTGYSHVEVATFLAGLGDGRVVLINENGKVFNITSLEGSVVRMLYHEERDIFIATTDIGMLTHHQLLPDGTSSQEIMKVKLAFRTPNPTLIWAGPTTLAICLGESMLRMWDIDREENYTLTAEPHLGYLDMCQISVADYCVSEKTLVAGTSKGQVVTWKFKTLQEDTVNGNRNASFNLEQQWTLQPATNLLIEDGTSSGSVEKLVASSSNKVAVSMSTNIVFLLEEHPLLFCSNLGLVVRQVAARRFYVRLYDTDPPAKSGGAATMMAVGSLTLNDCTDLETSGTVGKIFNIEVEHAIRNMACTMKNLAISDGSFVYSYDLDFGSPDVISSCGKFECSSSVLRLHELDLYVLDQSDVQIRNLQGTVKQLLDISGMDGCVNVLDVNNNFMICSTDKCSLRVFDLSRREPKPICAVKNLGDSLPSVTSVISAAVNCDGSCVSLLVERQRRGPESKLFFWHPEHDSLQYFNFSTGLGEQDDSAAPASASQLQLPITSTGQRPVSSSRSQRQKSGSRSARKSARSQNRRRRQQGFSGSGEAAVGRGDMSAVTQSILYDDDEDDGEYDSEEDTVHGNHSPAGSVSTVDSSDTLLLANAAAIEVAGRVPTLHFWDRSDPRIVVTELHTHRIDGDTNHSKDSSKIASLFATQDDGVLIFDSFSIPEDCSQLIAFDAPYFYLATKIDVAYRRQSEKSGTVSMTENNFIDGRVMRDFQGLRQFDRANKSAILNFSYFLTIGSMDEAFKAMKLIRSEAVWSNMARMCVKTRRLDVASVCLGKMGNARAAMHLREEANSGSDSRIAVLALQLGMKEEAIQLLQRSRRYDVLNELYQAMAEWDLALEVAEKHDRIHLKTTYYKYAKYLEEEMRFSEAIENFVKSGTHAFEVPRMLFDHPEDLEKFIRERPEKSLKKWWAQYMECCGQMQTALEFYTAAGDHLSLVRAYWLLGYEARAVEHCNETGDPAACYHLARQFEAAGNVDRAVHYFSRARAYSSAIRLCQEHGRDEHLVNLALLGTREDQLAAAQYLQHRPGLEDKAVLLFHKSGQASRAVDLALRTRQFGALQAVSGDMAASSDPAQLQKCAAFFMDNHQFDRAVDLLASNKQLWEALKLCVEYNVPMTEELAEKLTPPKSGTVATSSNDCGPVNSGAAPEYTDAERCRLLEGVAEIALSQRQYHVACKKFTQAGNQLQAMKALLRSGDTHKVVLFANVAKTREVYVLAANYLQTLDWRAESDIVKQITQFYTRGKAIDRLAAFYEACAQTEIEEFQDYGKALSALAEAHKFWSKVKFDSEAEKVNKLDHLRDQCTLMKKFTVAVELLDSSADEALQQCQLLLDEPDLALRGLRCGDIYAVMIRYFMRMNKFKAAYSCFDEMKGRISNPAVVTAYLDVKLLETLHRTLNLPFRPPTTTTSAAAAHNSQTGKFGAVSDEEGDLDDVMDDGIVAGIDEDQ